MPYLSIRTIGRGKNKPALIGWDRLTKQKPNGGLGLSSFRDIAAGLKMKYVARLLNGETSEWATMAKHLIHKEMKARAKRQEYLWWSVEEGLLLLPIVPSPKNSTVQHLTQRLEENPEIPIPERPGMEHPQDTLISTILHWKNLADELARAELTVTEIQAEEVANLQRLLQKTKTEVDRLQIATVGDGKVTRSNGKGNMEQCRIVQVQDLGVASPKTWVFRGARAERIRVSEESCKRNGEESETIEHLLWGCRHVRSIWEQLRRIMTEQRSVSPIAETLLGMINKALFGNQSHSPLLHIVATLLQSIWSDRNRAYHEGRGSSLPLLVTLKRARIEIEGLALSLRSREVGKNLEAQWDTITHLIGDS
ncbi:hypothetical protein R1sor_025335 [Riccia sorocarpa]|uniref:Reverse transcriptase n=1 Tax=Riccia sorocarpa TaxID=122646 RepID=A0ABD3G9V4_9MARC